MAIDAVIFFNYYKHNKNFFSFKSDEDIYPIVVNRVTINHYEYE